MKKILCTLALSFFGIHSAMIAQSSDSLNIRKIYDMSLLNGKSYEWLDHLSNQIGGRLSGSFNAEQAVEYTKKELENLATSIKLFNSLSSHDENISAFREYSFKLVNIYLGLAASSPF